MSPSSKFPAQSQSLKAEQEQSQSQQQNGQQQNYYHHHANKHNNNSNNNNTTNTNNWLERLDPPIQFTILACGVFLFFGIHNYLQEAIMHIPGFTFGVMLGYLEVLGVTVCSYLERTCIQRETQRIAPLSAYPLLTFCLLSSSSLSNLALNYINFPTKVVFRSCKLIPTMIVASIVHQKVFTSMEYTCAICISVGLVLFAAADWELAPSFHPIGLLFVSLSVCADAVLPNAQERLFRMGSSRLEVTFFTNIFTLIAMTVTTLLSGDLIGMITFARTNTQLQLYIMVYTFIAYVAISVHMNVVRRFGGVAAVLVATGRKAMTLILSFLLFPKAFSWLYVLGAILVLGGLLVASLVKIRARNNSNNNNKNIRSHPQPIPSRDVSEKSASSSVVLLSSTTVDRTHPNNIQEEHRSIIDHHHQDRHYHDTESGTLIHENTNGSMTASTAGGTITTRRPSTDTTNSIELTGTEQMDPLLLSSSSDHNHNTNNDTNTNAKTNASLLGSVLSLFGGSRSRHDHQQ